MDLSYELVSVIMGIKYTRDDLSFLYRSIESILRQSYPKLELIICERGSSSDAKDYLQRCAANDRRIKLIDGSDTRSFSEQLNKCLEAAAGKWIARMDDDDFSYPERIEHQINFLKSHDEYGFVGCQATLLQDGIEIGTTKFPSSPEIGDFMFSQPYIHPTLVFRSSALKTVNGYSQLPFCERCEDYDMLLRLYEAGIKGYNLDTPYFIYTLPPNGVTTRNFRDRINESKMRYHRYKSLKLLPKKILYVAKPIIVGMIPPKLLAKLKSKRGMK